MRRLTLLLIFSLCALSSIEAENSFRDRRQEGLAKSLQEYEVIVPQVVTESGSFLSNELNDAIGNERVYIRFRAFGEEFLLDLRKNRKLVDPKFTSEILDNFFHQPPRANLSRNCYYIGSLRFRPQSSVALSGCHGLMGLIQTVKEDYFIEPMAKTKKQHHVFYKRSTLLATLPQSSTFSRKCTLSSTHPQAHGNSKNTKWQFWRELIRRQRRSLESEVTVQLLVVVDRDMINFHGNQSVEEYVLTVMNMVADLYRDPSIGTTINIEVSKLMLLYNMPKGLSISHHGDRTLESFCKWQQWITKDKSSENPTYDGAVLLTRKDICANRYSACDTVGMAFLHGMCDPKKRCSVSQDNGLNVAFTVAHEIGHNLGAYHDGDGNTCPDSAGSTPHLMSPQWLARNRRGTMKWSWCSKAYIRSFLNSKASKCLRNHAEEKPLELPAEMPGVTFTVDDQCRQQYGNRARHCHKYKYRLCQQLWCEIEGEKLCRSKLNPPATGTACATGKWCMYGECVDNSTIPLRRDGGWGPWTEWSKCSRTCGMGVSAQKRECDSPSPLNGGRYCEGESRKFRTCNVKPCLPRSRDFRTLQCESFNGITYRGGKHEWVPVISDGQPCSLFCKPKDPQYRFSAKLASKVIDGTPCRPGSIDICIDGRCQDVGCDHKIGSGAEEDICGVCKGNGTTCRTVEGRFNQLAGSGYVEAAVIPEGARSISISESKPCTSFLALRADAGTYYINGNWRIQLPGDVNADGTIFRYMRKGTLEKIIARGPTNAPLHIMVLYYGFNLGVEYRYAVPLHENKKEKEDAKRHRLLHEASYGWVHGGWGECNVHCGGGIRKSLRMRCIRFYRGNISLVQDFYCKGATKPRQEERVCNVHQCPIWWAVSPWRPCSKTCGPGLQYRSVTCMHQTRDGTTEESSSHLCPSDKPSGVQNCIKKACHLNWMAGPWSQCHGLCDVGYRLRKVRCPVEGKCAHREKPRTRKPCFKGSCYDWTTGKWGSCSAGCGSGMQSRPVTCTHRLTGKTGNTCNAGSKPATARECKLKECKEIDVVLETVCFKDKYSSKQCQAVVKYNLCSTRAWLDLCCKTCQDAGRL
ncbi:A disintegrin and metalloproteinase with thrombospondin motifs 19-like [Oculina patagonica]